MKSDNKKILNRGLILAAILVILIYGINELCRVAVYNERYEIINHIENVPEDSIDIMIVGNSHAQEGLNAELMSDILKSEVYNFSFSQQQTPAAYYFLNKNLKKQSPEIVMVEAFTLLQHIQAGYEFIPLSPAKIKYYSMSGDECSLQECLFPISSNHNFWAKEKPFEPVIKNLTAGRKKPEDTISAMIMSEDAVIKHENFNSEYYAKELYEYRFDNLLEIQKLCKENGTEFVLFMLPLYGRLVESINYTSLYYDRIKSFCDENNIEYYDFNIESKTDWTYKYFREQDYTHNTHLNSYGRILASIELSDFIVNELGHFSINQYTERTQKLDEFLYSLDFSNDILIIDDCPNNLNIELNNIAADFFKENNIILKEKELDIVNDENEKLPEIYYISGNKLSSEYKQLEDIDYIISAVNIYELDSSGNILKQAVVRWDEFDIVLIR